MRTPHTHFTKGKTVWVKLRDGGHVTGRFQKRTARHVILDCATIETRMVAAMGVRKKAHTANVAGELLRAKPSGIERKD